MHFVTLGKKVAAAAVLLGLIVSAQATTPAPAIGFILADIGASESGETRTFQVQVGGEVVGSLSITCESGKMVSAAYQPDGARGDSGEVARRADNRLCRSSDLRP